MRYAFIIFTLTACGILAANVDADVTDTAVDTENSSEEKVGEENAREMPNSLPRGPTYTNSNPDPGAVVGHRSPIPAIILPNNVCVINTDLSPDRSIEEHILACIRAQQIRRSIQK
jgi:hypothetical protein